jgi:hypothetical protein
MPDEISGMGKTHGNSDVHENSFPDILFLEAKVSLDTLKNT